MSTLYTLLPDFLFSPLFWVFVLLSFAIWQFIRNTLRMDVVALLIMLFFSLSGILTVKEVFIGLSDPNVILIALLFVVGEGLVRTGIAYQVSEWLMRVAGASEVKVLILLMLSIAGLGAFMSSTGIVAIFIPVVLAICSGMKISPRRLMMPLSIAGLISGMMTLIATPPNLIAHSELLRAGFEGFNFFSFTPIGAAVLILAIGYMLIARHWLDNGETITVEPHANSSMIQLIQAYQLQGRAQMVLINEDSPCIGKTINELHLRSQYGMNIISIQRVKRLRRRSLSAYGNEILQAKDILLLDIDGVKQDSFVDYCIKFGFKAIALKGEYFSDHTRSIGMAEISISPHSDYLGKSILALKFRSQTGLSVVGLKREGVLLVDNIAETPLQIGDVLLVMGLWHQILSLNASRDFFLLNTPEESQKAAPASSQAPYALLAVFTMVLLMITGLVPNVIAALIACLMLGKFRCIDMQSAYQSIHFPSLLLIVGMMPFSIALQKTGGIDLLVAWLSSTLQGMNSYLILAVLFTFTAIISAFISNTATAILVMPIAIAIAQQLSYSPIPFVMIVAISASAAFMTPVSSPVNTMVLAPGNYKFLDFIKIGVPFTLLVMLLAIFLVPYLFPL